MKLHFITITMLISVISSAYSLVLNATNLPTEPIEFNKTANPDNLKFLEIGPEELSWEGCPKQLDNKIKSVKDLHKHINDLNCIFHWGETPLKVPIGIWQGSVLSVLSQTYTNQFLDLAWTDKLVYEDSCRQEITSGNVLVTVTYKIFRGVNHIFKVPILGFVVYIRELKSFLNPEDYDDGKNALIVDYNQDYKQPCLHNSEANPNNLLDVPQMYHALRIVGQTEDKGTIYLGKAYYVQNPVGGTLGKRETYLWAWFAVVNYGNPDIIVPARLLDVPDCKNSTRCA